MTHTTSALANEPARRAASQQTWWMNQDVEYDFTADLTGTGDRSEYEQICDGTETVQVTPLRRTLASSP